MTVCGYDKKGNVGIGTTDPTYKLEVVGNVSLGDTNIGGDMSVTGDMEVVGNVSLGDTNIGGDMSVTGDVEIAGKLNCSKVVNPFHSSFLSTDWKRNSTGSLTNGNWYRIASGNSGEGWGASFVVSVNEGGDHQYLEFKCSYQYGYDFTLNVVQNSYFYSINPISAIRFVRMDSPGSSFLYWDNYIEIKIGGANAILGRYLFHFLRVRRTRRTRPPLWLRRFFRTLLVLRGLFILVKSISFSICLNGGLC